MNLESNRVVIGEFRDLVSDKVRISDASGWSRRLIYSHLLGYRNRLLYEKMHDPKYKLSELNYQTIQCIKLDEINVEECPCEIPSDFSFKRSVYPIPTYIGNLTVKGNIRTDNYDYVKWDEFKYKLNSRFENERVKPYWTIAKTTIKGVEGNYLYILNNNWKELTSVIGIFADPLEVAKFPDCDGKVNKCLNALDAKFVIDPQLKPLMYDMALQQLLKSKATLQDTVNNNLDDVSNNRNQLK